MSASPALEMLQSLDARVKVCCLVVFMLVVFRARTAASLALLFVCACTLAVAASVGWRRVMAALRPFATIVVFTVIVQVVSVQQGQVLAQLSALSITVEGIAQAACMLVRLATLLLASLAFARCTGAADLASAFDWVLAPLRALGVGTRAASFTLSVAFRFIPVLVDDFQQLKRAQEVRFATFDGSVRARLHAYTRLFPPLVRSAFRRADTLAEASVSRCLPRKGKTTLLHPARVGLPDIIAIVITAAALVLSFAI